MPYLVPIFWSYPSLKVLLPLEPAVVVPGKPLVFNMNELLQRVTIQIHKEVSSFWIRNPEGTSICISRHREEWRMSGDVLRENDILWDHLLFPTSTQGPPGARRKAKSHSLLWAVLDGDNE